MDKTKFCIRCKREKDINEFNHDKNNKDGLTRWCKQCQSEYNKLRSKGIILPEIETKICGKCNKEKEIDEFSRDKYSKDGYHSLCKQCRSKHHKKWYLDNAEKTRNKY